MENFRFFAGAEKNNHYGSLGNRRYDLFPDAVSLVVAQSSQSLRTTAMVAKAFYAASSNFLSVAFDTTSNWDVAGGLYRLWRSRVWFHQLFRHCQRQWKHAHLFPRFTWSDSYIAYSAYSHPWCRKIEKSLCRLTATTCKDRSQIEYG